MESIRTKRDILWAATYETLKRYVEAGNEPNAAGRKAQFEKVNIGAWLSAQRRNFANNRLSPKRTAKLLAIGVVLDPLDARWEEAYGALKRHLDAANGVTVTQRWISPEGLRIGSWISTQVAAFRTGHLRPDRAKRLCAIGIQCVREETPSKQKIQEDRFKRICKDLSVLIKEVQMEYPDARLVIKDGSLLIRGWGKERGV